MQNKLTENHILNDFHNENLKEHKLFLRLLLNEERNQNRLRKLYENTPKDKKKKRENIKRKIKKRKEGRQRICFDYETAKEIVRSEGIMSSIQYARWHEMNHPVRMPKNPDRAYKSNWTTWGDFLGFHNQYVTRKGERHNGKGKYRSFESARAFARSLNLTKIQDWRDYTKTGKCPADIPHRPDIVYTSGKRKEYWLSWKDFLGYDIKNTVEKIAEVSPIIYIGKRLGSGPANIYIINVIPGGKAALEDHVPKMNMKLICAFYTNANFNIKSFINTLDKYPNGNIDEYMITNIFDVIESLQDSLEQVF